MRDLTRIVTISATSFVLLIGAAFSQAQDAPSTGSVGTCDVIDGKTYISVVEMEVGLSPNGLAAMGKWRVRFSNGRWDWGHSDVTETGNYTCNGTSIVGGRYSGSLDPMTGVLTWEGAEYTL